MAERLPCGAIAGNGANQPAAEVRFTLALTPALSLEERENAGASQDNLDGAVAIAAPLQFVFGIERQTEMLILSDRGGCFSLSWGRGLG